MSCLLLLNDYLVLFSRWHLVCCRLENEKAVPFVFSLIFYFFTVEIRSDDAHSMRLLNAIVPVWPLACVKIGIHLDQTNMSLCRDCEWATLFITVRPNSGASKRGETMTNQLAAATTEPLGSWQTMAVLFHSECHNVSCMTNKNHLVAWFAKTYYLFFALDACCKIHQSFSRVKRMCFDVLHLKVTSHCCNAAYAEVPLRSADMRSLWAEQKTWLFLWSENSVTFGDWIVRYISRPVLQTLWQFALG